MNVQAITMIGLAMFLADAAAAQGRPEDRGASRDAQAQVVRQQEREEARTREEEKAAEGARERNETRDRERAEQGDERAADAPGGGISEQARERNEERREIREEYESRTEGAEHAGKKPWWKFWGGDEDDRGAREGEPGQAPEGKGKQGKGKDR